MATRFSARFVIVGSRGRREGVSPPNLLPVAPGRRALTGRTHPT
ncbi:hypothetical protein ACFPM0_33840 [Pseudonocardia sulfidoxydans]